MRGCCGGGQVEVTPAVNPVFVTERGQTEHEWTDIGARAQFGISNRLNVGAGYIRSNVSDGDFALHTVLFGPKVSLMPDRVAFALPVGFSFGEEIDVVDTWQLNPTSDDGPHEPACRLTSFAQSKNASTVWANSGRTVDEMGPLPFAVRTALWRPASNVTMVTPREAKSTSQHSRAP